MTSKIPSSCNNKNNIIRSSNMNRNNSNRKIRHNNNTASTLSNYYCHYTLVRLRKLIIMILLLLMIGTILISIFVISSSSISIVVTDVTDKYDISMTTNIQQRQRNAPEQQEITKQQRDNTTKRTSKKCAKLNGNNMIYIPRNNNRTLMILLSSSILRQNKYNQLIQQSVYDNVLLTDTNASNNMDVAILYFYSNNDITISRVVRRKNNGTAVTKKENIIHPNFINQKLKTFYGNRLKYIWPINVTKYETYYSDWGMAINDIIYDMIKEKKTDLTLSNNANSNNNDTKVVKQLDYLNNLIHTTTKNKIPKWRNQFLIQKRNDDNDEYNLFGGVRPCYYFLTQYNLNKTCSGMGMKQNLLFYYLQQYLTTPIKENYSNSDTTSKSTSSIWHYNYYNNISNSSSSSSSSSSTVPIIDQYDRFILTHSNIYHLCHHPDVSTLDPNYIWTPAVPSMNDSKNQSVYVDSNRNNADQLGIPATHWIVSYQHILGSNMIHDDDSNSSTNANRRGGILDILPQLIQNYNYYLKYEHLADMNVQRLIRSVWLNNCLLQYHRRFYRTMISTTPGTSSNNNNNNNNNVSTVLSFMYPGEYELTEQVCYNDNKSNNKMDQMARKGQQHINDPNDETAYAMATAAIDDTSYIYPHICNINGMDDDNDGTSIVKEYGPLPIGPNYANNKTLVIIMGNLRGGEIAWSTLYKNLLDYNNADLALLIGNDIRDVYQNSTIIHRAKYIWKFQEHSDWSVPIDTMFNDTLIQHQRRDTRNDNNINEADYFYDTNYFDGNDSNIERNNHDDDNMKSSSMRQLQQQQEQLLDWRKSILPYINPREGLFGGVRGHLGSGAIIMVIRYFLQQKIKELRLIHKYERFIITRADHYYLCPHNVSELSLEYLWTPDGGSDYYGITDRHLIVSNRYVLQALDVFPTMFRYPKAFIALNLGKMNPERLIQYTWRFNCILNRHKQFERVMFTCGTDGDTSRWQRMGTNKVPEGVMLKYANEYYSSKATCRKLQGRR